MEPSLKRLKKEIDIIQTYPLSRSLGYINFQNKRCLDFTNRDSLGLGFNRKVLRAIHEGIERDSLSPSFMQLEAENCLAKFLRKEASIIFSSKTQSLFTLLSCLCSENDNILCDEHSPLPVYDIGVLIGAEVSEKPVGQKFTFFISELLDPRTGDKVSPPLASQNIFDISEALILDETIDPDAILFGDLGALGFPSLGFIAGSLKLKSHILGLSKTLKRDGLLPSFLFDGIIAAIEEVKLVDVEKVKLMLLSLGSQSKGLFHAVKLNYKPKYQDVLGCLFEFSTFHTKGKENHYAKIYPSIAHTEENLKLAKSALEKLLT